MAIDVCLLFNVAVVLSSTYFRFDWYDNRRDESFVLADNKQDDRVRCASPIFMLIAYYTWALQTGNGNMSKKR